MLRPYDGQWPKLGERVYVDASAQVIGDVELGDHASVWMNAVLRGDVSSIRVGPYSNVQDLCVIHAEKEHPTLVADHVTVGHSVTLHGCRIDSFCLIGMGSTILNGAHVGEESIVGAGALVPEGMVVPPRSLVMGVPARVRRPVTEDERKSLRASADHYCEYKETYLRETAGPLPSPQLKA
jgi:carbonic anhydrase/acetyltransferase-like protein (isoleucine patch superfamily)